MDHLFKKVKEAESGCWLWVGYLNNDGYAIGECKKISKSTKAHRIFYEYFIGSVPRDKELDHLCGFRCCVNPFHLEPVTHKENVRRGKIGEVNKKRQQSKTTCRNGHKYSKENTYVDPKIYGKQKSPSRHCITCKYEAHERWRQRCKNKR